MTRTARPGTGSLCPRSIVGSVAVHTALIGAGVLWGALAPGGGARPIRAFAAAFAARAPSEPEPREALEPLAETALPEPELAESEVWDTPDLALDPRDEPRLPPALRAADWSAERPFALGTLGPDLEAPALAASERADAGPPALTVLAEPVRTLVVEPAALRTPAPSYPRLSRRAGEEGSVLCRLHLDAEGAVLAVEVVESSGHARLDEAARSTLGGWIFEPRREDGRAVPSTLLHRVTFRLGPG